MTTSALERLKVGQISGWVSVGVGVLLQYVGVTIATSRQVSESSSSRDFLSTISGTLSQEKIVTGGLISQVGSALLYLGFAMILIVFALKLIAAIFKPEALTEPSPPIPTNFAGE